MNVSRSSRRPGRFGRRLGYTFSIVLNLLTLSIINVYPGWEAASFLTPAAGPVVTALNAATVAALIANVIYLSADPPWLRALGDVITTGLGLLVLVSAVRLFPFALDSQWQTTVRIALWGAILGLLIALVLQFSTLVRTLFTSKGAPS